MAPPLSIADLELILAHTRELWPEMRGQRVFITGGTGFFGCWLVESFLHANRALQLGAQATVLTRDPQAFAQKCPHLASDPAITLLTGDVRDFRFPQGGFSYVVHAASEINASDVAPEAIWRGAERTLQFAAAHGTQKFLLTSSGAVYRPQPASITHMPEGFGGAPDTAYGKGKRAAELLCAQYAGSHGMECKIARCYAFAGPHLPLDGRFAIGNFIRDAMRGDVIDVQGDGTLKRSYMYAADLTIWLWTMLFRAPSLEVFNVGSEQAVSILELAHAVHAALGSKAGVHVAREAVEGAAVEQYVPSTRKAERQLGLQCHVSLEEAILRTAVWHRYCARLDPLDLSSAT
jgi:nucleoside-diphosphate-sugar epimerase